jgi:membrane-bound lytic murein transglycosylase D
MITHDMHFDQLAACMNIQKSELRFLNPQYKKDFIPAKNKPRHLLLPVELIDDYIAIEDTVYLYKDSIYLNSKSLTYKPSESSPGNYAPATQPSGSEKLLYTIKSGDAVGLIASWYNVGIAELKAWNGMYSNNIRAGKKLVVYVPKEKLNYYSGVDNMSKAAKQKRNGINPDSGKKIQAPLDSNYEYYTVKSGDNPWIIANKFSGISVNEILKLNGITNASSLQVGQKIKIRKKI